MTEDDPTIGVVAAENNHQDLVDVLVSDHRTVEELLRRLTGSDWQPQRQRDLIDVTIAELMRHTMAEEQYLYPAVREHLDDGDELAAQALIEHRQAEWLMSDLMGTDPAHPGFEALVQDLITKVRAHIRDEESTIFPQLRAACGPEIMVDLGTEALSAKKLAPTRPHPAVPLNKVIGPMVGLFDQAVDALTDRPTSVEEL